MGADAACPKCGSRDVRLSRARTLGERIKELAGVYPLRCRGCENRFASRVFKPSHVVYARCPNCYRLELTTWSLQYYNPDLVTRTKLNLGATPYRCDACRRNFASFRPCKERLLWRRAGDANEPPESES